MKDLQILTTNLGAILQQMELLYITASSLLGGRNPHGKIEDEKIFEIIPNVDNPVKHGWLVLKI